MSSKNFSLSQLALVALITLVVSTAVVSIFSLWESNSTLKEQKQMLTASYVRLADILSGVSRKICDEIHEFNDGLEIETVVENCKHIDEIVIELKTIDYLTEEKRLEYNKNLLEITEYIFKVARELKDEKMAIEISKLKQKLDREMAIVQNKNVKLENSNQYLKAKLEETKSEKAQVLSEKRTTEQQLYQALQQRDEARGKAAELSNSMARQEQELENLKKENAKTNKNEIEEEDNITENIVEEEKIEKENASLIPIPEEKENLSYDKLAIREQLTNYLMLFSPKRRDRKLRSKVRNYFANPNENMITVKGNKSAYSPNNYLSRLTVTGPYDIMVNDIEFDLQGKITKLEVAEVKLER
ncbi:MAG: hypothetical protein ACPG5B_10475 [Chitinophagales bacterium]